MKVLHLISSGGMYGAEAVILNMSRILNNGPHASLLGVFANSSNPNVELHESAVAEGMESHLIPCRGQFDRIAITAIRELAVRTGADVVHAHGYKADIYTYLSLRGTKIPLVSTCHTWYDNDLAVRLYGAADRFVLRKYSRVVAVSEQVKERLLKAGVGGGKICLIRNGIDLGPFLDAAPILRETPSELIVGLVGRLAQEKGVDVFLRAVPVILTKAPEARFVVVGDGPDREMLAGLIAELGIGGKVTMLGRRDDMPSVYASLDVMVSASRQEGLPMAILEGMASGRALVATPVGAVPLMVKDGVTGVLVPAGDERALADAVAGLLREPARRRELGSGARELIEQEFSAERMAEDYLRVYAEAIGPRGRGR